MARLRQWMAAERADLWVVVLYSVGIGVLSLVVPVATQSMVNTIAFGTVLQPVVLLALVVLAVLGFSSVLRALRTWVVEVIQRRVFVRVASDAVLKLLRVKIDAFDHGHGPELVNRFFDVVTVQKGGAILLVDGLAILMQTIVGLLLLAVYHPLLLGFGVMLVFAIVIILFPLGSGAIGTAVKESKAKYSFAAWLEEIARYPMTFKTPHGAAMAMSRANALADDYLAYREKHFRVLFRQIRGSLVLETLASAVLLAAGGFLVINRQLTLGQLVAAELIVAVVVGGFAKFGKQLETFYDIVAAVDKLGYLTDLPAERSGSERLPRPDRPAHLRLAGVSFAYEGHSPVIRGVNWTVEQGARVAVFAASGSGKSTLFDIICGLRRGDGLVELDGYDYRSLSVDSLREQVALVRDAEVFQGSIADNVSLGSDAAGQSEIRGALQQVGLLDTILRMPDGLATELATGGLPLSRGQGLRLAIARAILHRPRLLVIDETLDPLLESGECEDIRASLFDRKQPWTLIVATKNAALMRQCDAVYEMAGGRLEARSAAPLLEGA